MKVTKILWDKKLFLQPDCFVDIIPGISFYKKIINNVNKQGSGTIRILINLSYESFIYLKNLNTRIVPFVSVFTNSIYSYNNKLNYNLISILKGVELQLRPSILI